MTPSYEQALETVAAALKTQGFGVLTRIDLRAMMREKLGVDLSLYAIRGVCNPPLAHRALTHRTDASLLMPCTVTAEAAPDDNGTIIRIADPKVVMTVANLANDAELVAVAGETREKLVRLSEELKKA